jgi:hypothetical protein
MPHRNETDKEFGHHVMCQRIIITYYCEDENINIIKICDYGRRWAGHVACMNGGEEEHL